MKPNPTDPRVITTRTRVLAASRTLMASEGQAAVTPTRLAEITGVSRSTIYRNWDEPAAIVLEAITDDAAGPPFEPSGDLRIDLTRYLEILRDGLGMPHTTLLAARIDQAERNPATADVLSVSTANRRNLMAGILNQSLDGFDAAHASIVGPLFFQRFIAHEPITDELIDRIVDSYILSLASRP